MEITLPSHYASRRDQFPPRPEGTHPVVFFANSTVVPTPLYELIDTDPVDSQVRVSPLDPADERQPFWLGPQMTEMLREIPGAYVDDRQMVCLATNGTDPDNN